VDVDYYIDMGGAAYQQVAARYSGEEVQRAVYEELAAKFGTFVEVYAEVSEKTSPRTEKDLLRLYELWVRTRSERAAKALAEAGILPNDTIKKDWQ
jgi:cytochrome c551/c552